MRIFAVSDLHNDFGANRALLDELPRREYRRDVLLMAGDIADRLTVLGDTLGVLRSRFSEVFYAPGNHELWVRDGRCDSLEKLGEVLLLCERLGVRPDPAPVGGVWVVPLFSWYRPGFDDGGEEAAPGEVEVRIGRRVPRAPATRRVVPRGCPPPLAARRRLRRRAARPVHP